jgi:hypothetical protein
VSIAIEGMKDLVSVDLYPLARTPADRGRASLKITIPEGTVYHLVEDRARHDWVWTDVGTREDGCVAVDLEVVAKESYPLTMVVTWGQDQEVVRGPCEERFHLVLDGLPKRVWKGFSLEEPGGPERDPSFVPHEVG